MTITLIVVTVLLLLCAALHGFFAYGEMVPREKGIPMILAKVLNDRDLSLGQSELKGLVVTIVQNAGAYNVIMTVGFVLAALLPHLRLLDFGIHGVSVIQGFFCVAAIWAGIYGMSLSKSTKWQAILAAVGLLAVIGSCIPIG